MDNARQRASLVALLVMTAPALYGSYLLFAPFFSSLAWAVAFAVIGNPVHRALRRRISSTNLAAGLAVLLVAAVLIVPAVAVSGQLVRQSVLAVQLVTSEQTTRLWHDALASTPQLGEAVEWATANVDLRGPLNELATRLPVVLSGSAVALGQLGISLFCLFFFFRDQAEMLAYLRSWLPLSEEETDDVSRRIHEIIQATIFGKLTLAAVQGSLAGLMMWWVGLPGAFFWGLVMSILGLVPFLGAFIVWGPASLYLVLLGSWGKGLALALWGLLVVSTVDNVLYPFLVGHRMQLHALATFFTVVGGLAVFGASGIILGPVLLATTVTLAEVCRRRIIELEPPPAEVQESR